MEEKKRVSFGQAVILLVIAIAVIIIVKAWLAADTSVSLLCAAAPVCALAMIWGVKWDDIETEIKENFKIARVFSQLSSIYGLSRPSASM